MACFPLSVLPVVLIFFFDPIIYYDFGNIILGFPCAIEKSLEKIDWNDFFDEIP